MNKSFSQKHPYISVILIGLLCTFLTALGAAIPQVIGLDENSQIVVTTIFLILSVIIGILIMKKSRYTINEYGFQKSKKDSRVWWYLPLLVIEILPIAMIGFSTEVTLLQYFILLAFTVAVGFNEEIYFRGLALKVIEEKGRKKAIIVTSLVFGILHLVNVFNGKNAFYLILQMLFAFLVGFVLAEIVTITKSLWAVIIWHAAHDYISSITGDALDRTALIVLAIQVVILLIYSICIWQKTNVESNPI